MHLPTLTLALLTLPAIAHDAATLVTQGEAQQQAGQLAQAETSYRHAHTLDPASLAALAHLATVLEQEHQPAAAILYWKQALHLDASNPEIKFSLATALLDNGDNQPAATLYRELLAAQPAPQTNRGELLLNLGTALARLTQYDDAAHTYRQALAFPSVADTAHIALIKALVTLLRYSDAEPYARQYLAAHPADYEALYFCGLIDRGLGNTAAAQRELASAVVANPRQFDAQLTLGALLRQHGQPAEAIPHLEQAVQLQPGAKDAHFQLARAYAATGQKALAQQQDTLLQQEEEQATQQTQIIVLGNQAAEAIDHHDPAQAISMYQHIAQLDPHNARVLYDLAMLSLDQGKTAQAHDLLTQAHTLDPAMPEVNAELGYLDLLAGHKDAAQAELQLALKSNPQSTEALGNLGVLDAQQGQTDQAIHLLRLAVEHDPNYEQGHLNLGLILAATGQLPEAATELQQAVDLSPTNTRATTALAAVRQKLAKRF